MKKPLQTRYCLCGAGFVTRRARRMKCGACKRVGRTWPENRGLNPKRGVPLTWEQVAALREAATFEFPAPGVEVLSQRFALSPAVVRAILSGDTWRRWQDPIDRERRPIDPFEDVPPTRKRARGAWDEREAPEEQGEAKETPAIYLLNGAELERVR